jgi:arylformamidase
MPVSRMYDISIPVRAGGVVYPRNPPISIELEQSIANGGSSNVSRITFGSHTGTHVDSARHFFDDAEGVDAIPLDRLMGPALLIAFADEVMSIGIPELRAHELRAHKRILLRTRNSGLLHDSEFHPDYTFLAPDGAEYLVSRGVQLVGIDYLSVEQFHSGHHLTHRTLLRAGVVIVEGLDLSEPPPGEYELTCLPLRLAGLDGAPARAVLRG